MIHPSLRRIRTLAAGLAIAGALATAGPAHATDYTVTGQTSCLAFAAAIGTTASWSFGDTCSVNGGTLQAADRLFVTGPLTFRPQGPATFTNKGSIEIAATGANAGFYGAAPFINEGTVTILSGDEPLNFSGIYNQGTFATAVPFFNPNGGVSSSGTITNACGATLEGTYLGIPILRELCPDPAYPAPTDVRTCQDTIAKATIKYVADRHKALAACRTALLKGTLLYADKAKTVPVTTAPACPTEYTAAGKIAKAGQKLRDGVAAKCPDAVLATMTACGKSADALADATGSSGCLVDTADVQVEGLLAAEYGY